MNPPSKCLLEKELWEYVDEPALANITTASHIADCAQCKTRAESVHSYRSMLRSAFPLVETPGLHLQPLAKRYEFLRRLGAGGFGEVWLARDLRLPRKVAIKTLRSDKLMFGGLDSLRHEAEILANLSSDRRARRHIVQVFDWEEIDDRAYLIMEYVEGGSLGDRIRMAGPLAWRPAVRYVADIGEALAITHSAGLLHCDLKPDNILWDAVSDEAMLADFGIAARMSDTKIGGTLGYIAPEIVVGRASAASDVFALAATIYCLVTGKPPFSGSTLEESVEAATAGLATPDLLLARVPSNVEKAIRRGLAASPSDRPTLREFVDNLRGAGAFALGAAIAELVASHPTKNGDATTHADLSAEVFCSSDNNQYVPADSFNLFASTGSFRDLQFVPPEPPSYRIPADSFVKFRYRSTTGGYLTLVNVGSSGRTVVVFPNLHDRDNLIPPGGVKEVIVRVTPPPGTDEAIGILTPRNDQAQKWRGELRSEQAIDATVGYEGYRDLEFIADKVDQAESVDWAVSVLKFVHDR